MGKSFEDGVPYQSLNDTNPLFIFLVQIIFPFLIALINTDSLH